MSKTLNKLDPKRLIVYFSGSVLSVIAGGRHRRFYAETSGKELLQDVYQAAKAFKDNPTKETEQKLLEYMDPDMRVPAGDGFVRDIEGNYYLEDLPHVPVAMAVKRMIDSYIEQGIDTTPVINMWKLLLDNPNEQARTDMMVYIERFGIPLTDSGYMILYKSVRDKNDVIEKLAYVVGQEYFDKMRHRENPATYFVYDLPPAAQEYLEIEQRFYVTKKGVLTYNEEVELEDDPDIWGEDDPDIPESRPEDLTLEPMGNLEDLFKEYVLSKQDLELTDEEAEPIWEPYHRGDYGMEIRLGKPVTMPREECDPDINRECSYGLHVGSYEYVHRFHASDGTVLACLVNPRDIVALPEYDNSKIRCCAYLPYGIIRTDENGVWEEVENTYWEEDFVDYEVEELENSLQRLHDEMERTDESKHVALEELASVVNERLVRLTA